MQAPPSNPESKPRKRLSRARRVSRVVVWSVFVVVMVVRWWFPPEPVEPAWQGGGGWEGRRRFERPPTRVQPAVRAVPGDLWRIEIAIAEPDVEVLRGEFWNGWGGRRSEERAEVQVTVREGGVVYTNVALHLKGAAGSFRPFDDKPALTLNFSKHAPGQRFHGMGKLSLNNSVQDPSYLSESISREMFLAAGVPTPRADHATVVINGRDLGLYVLVEGWGKPFLRRHFEEVGGNLYDGGFVQDIQGDLRTNSGDRETDRSDLEGLVEAAREPDLLRRADLLERVLDLERFFSFMAMEVMTCHWDGYCLNRNNYRVFHHVGTGRMVFMPHGMDQMFGISRSSPVSTIQPTMQGMVAQAVMSLPGSRERYLARMAELRSRVFVVEALTNRVRELAGRIRPTLAAYGEDVAAEHDYHVAGLVQRIMERAQSVSEQLASPGEPVWFDSQGRAGLSDWTPHPGSRRSGVVRFERGEQDGRRVLRIASGAGGRRGAWRTKALLEAGDYRFEGEVRTRGVGSTGGVALRPSGARDVWHQASDEGWATFSYPFRVEQALAEVELFCELWAERGEAWFDEGSLRLIRE